MSKLYIEDLAMVLGLTPEKLDRIQLRKFSLIIDYALSVKGISHDEDLENHGHSADEIINILAKAIKDGQFTELDGPNTFLTSKETLLNKILNCFEIPPPSDDNDDWWWNLYSCISNPSDYHKKILEQGLKHSKTLDYLNTQEVGEFSLQNAVIKASANLRQEYEVLIDELAKKYQNSPIKIKKFTLSKHFLGLNQNKKVKIKQAGYQLLNHSNDYPHLDKKDSTRIFNYYKLILDTAQQLTTEYGILFEALDKQNVYLAMASASKKTDSDIITHYISFLDSQLQSKLLMYALNPKGKIEKEVKQQLKLFCDLLVASPSSRQWKVAEEYGQDEPIDRVILIHKADLTDAETKKNIDIIIKKHPDENIVVAFDTDTVKLINFKNTQCTNHPFTLQVHGHGKYMQGCEVLLMTDEIEQNPKLALSHKLYLKNDGSYITRPSCKKYSLFTDEFGDPSIDLTDLSNEMLLDHNFVNRILNITAKRGHTCSFSESFVNSNLGPFRGPAEETGKKVAELVSQCHNITHVRLTGCATGKMRDDATLEEMTEKHRPDNFPDKDVRRTLIYIHPDNFTQKNNHVFFEKAAAVSCWNNINKENRQLTMTVSPNILQAIENKPYMQSYFYLTKMDEGIKEIQVKTSETAKRPRI